MEYYYKAQIVEEVEGLGTVYRVDAPLDDQLIAFAREGIMTLATPEEIAQISLAGIKDSSSRTSIAPIAIKGGKTVLVKNSPLMNPLIAFLAVEANKDGKYLPIDKRVYEFVQAIAKAETNIEPENRTALSVSRDGNFSLRAEMDETRFLLGKQNLRYFEKFVRNGEKGQIPFFGLASNSKDTAVVSYLYFNYPQDAYFNCGDMSLNKEIRSFGVLR